MISSRIMSAEGSTQLVVIGDLPIITDDETPQRALHEILALTRAENLTPIDAAYLELAIRRGLQPGINDKHIRCAGVNTGVVSQIL